MTNMAVARKALRSSLGREEIPEVINWIGTDPDELYSRLDAAYNGYSPNLEWVARSAALEREVREARLATRFDD